MRRGRPVKLCQGNVKCLVIAASGEAGPWHAIVLSFMPDEQLEWESVREMSIVQLSTGNKGDSGLSGLHILLEKSVIKYLTGVGWLQKSINNNNNNKRIKVKKKDIR